MITNTGKGIIAKYLIGQAPAYASYVAVGCGAKPIASAQDLGDYSSQKSLEFEMLRVPIISRGYVNEDGISKIVFTAELPSEERYEITEVGVYSAGSNPAVGFYGSKVLQAFNNESWEYHTASSSVAIPTIYEPLDGSYKDNAIHNAVSGDPAYGKPVFKTNADNRIFTDSTRISRYERCRFFNSMIAIAGNDSSLMLSGGHLSPQVGSNHIHLLGTEVNLNKNAPDDELRLAFSVINKSIDSLVPETVKVLIEFSSTDVHNEAGSQWARFEIVLENGTGPGQHDFESNRYVVAKKQLQELYKSSGFTWSTVDTVKVYASVEDNTGTPSENFYVCLDALRLENVSSENPLYGLTGYSVIVNSDANTIVKAANTTNFIEFRFAMDVQ